MPLFTAPSQCYMLPSGFYVIGEIARGEVISTTPGAIGIFTDADMELVRATLHAQLDQGIFVALTSGKWLLLTDNVNNTLDEVLQTLPSYLSGLFIPTHFVGATWPAGGTPYTVTAADPLAFDEDDRERFEVAIGKAMQKAGLYYDVDSVTRYDDTLTVTLDESQKPYDAGWDSVLALVAGWFGGEVGG